MVLLLILGEVVLVGVVSIVLLVWLSVGVLWGVICMLGFWRVGCLLR